MAETWDVPMAVEYHDSGWPVFTQAVPVGCPNWRAIAVSSTSNGWWRLTWDDGILTDEVRAELTRLRGVKVVDARTEQPSRYDLREVTRHRISPLNGIEVIG